MEFFGVQTQNPLAVELVVSIVDQLDVPDLFKCLVLNKSWYELVLLRLYKGSMNDMSLRTPDIGSLNCLLVASRERFKKNTSLVDHLLICPDTCPEVDPGSSTRVDCLESCRALRKREDSKVLLQGYSGARGFTSLAIPFHLKQDIGIVADLLFHKRLRFLTMDLVHFEDLIPALITNRLKPKMFANLQALSLLKSGGKIDIGKLCRLLKVCDLKLFQFQESHVIEGASEEDWIGELLLTLRGHRKLESGAFAFVGEDWPDGDLFTELFRSDRRAWPDMQALHLNTTHELWLRSLPGFTKLQILTLWNEGVTDPTVDQELLVKCLARCPELRTLDIWFRDASVDLKSMVDIARGCPMLRKFHVKATYGPDKADLLDLLEALPDLECLKLYIAVPISGTFLQKAATCCPRLLKIELPLVVLSLPYTHLTRLTPLRRLEILRVEKVLIMDPDEYLTLKGTFSPLDHAWRRAFPRLRVNPGELVTCISPNHHRTARRRNRRRYMSTSVSAPSNPNIEGHNGDEMDTARDGAESDSAGAELKSDEMDVEPIEEISTDSDGDSSLDSELESQKANKQYYLLSKTLWRAEEHAEAKFDHMWQTDFDIATVGWPFMPLSAYIYAKEHSSLSRRPFKAYSHTE